MLRIVPTPQVSKRSPRLQSRARQGRPDKTTTPRQLLLLLLLVLLDCKTPTGLYKDARQRRELTSSLAHSLTHRAILPFYHFPSSHLPVFPSVHTCTHPIGFYYNYSEVFVFRQAPDRPVSFAYRRSHQALIASRHSSTPHHHHLMLAMLRRKSPSHKITVCIELLLTAPSYLALQSIVGEACVLHSPVNF